MSDDWYRTTAMYDWFLTKKARLLHYARLTPEQCVELQETGVLRGYCKTWCGARLRGLTIPGVIARLENPRCGKCCRMLKFPAGTGSPRNDPECRRILGLPVDRQEHEPII